MNIELFNTESNGMFEIRIISQRDFRLIFHKLF